MARTLTIISLLAALGLSLTACGGGNEADRIGVASVCEVDEDCPETTVDDETVQLQCITDFRGGYCSIPDCENNADCPDGATCVLHDDGLTYCFRECEEKAECNANRPVEDEANCNSSFDYADPADDTEGLRACIPPSSD